MCDPKQITQGLPLPSHVHKQGHLAGSSLKPLYSDTPIAYKSLCSHFSHGSQAYLHPLTPDKTLVSVMPCVCVLVTQSYLTLCNPVDWCVYVCVCVRKRERE